MKRIISFTLSSALLFTFAMASQPASQTFAYGNNNHQNGFSQNIQSLNENDLSIAMDMYQEEMMARNVYQNMAKTYQDAPQFERIAYSEARHMNILARFIETSGADIPDSMWSYKSAYQDFVSKGSQSLLDAYNMGVNLEVTDIQDLEQRITKTKSDVLSSALEQLKKGSFHHLSAFAQGVESQGGSVSKEANSYLEGTSVKNDRGSQGYGFHNNHEAGKSSKARRACSMYAADGTESSFQNMPGRSSKGQGYMRGSQNKGWFGGMMRSFF